MLYSQTVTLSEILVAYGIVSESLICLFLASSGNIKTKHKGLKGLQFWIFVTYNNPIKSKSLYVMFYVFGILNFKC